MSEISAWWQKLPTELQRKLKANPDMNLTGDDVVAITNAGRLVAGAHWVGHDAPHFHLTQEEQAFVREQA